MIIVLRFTRDYYFKDLNDTWHPWTKCISTNPSSLWAVAHTEAFERPNS
jgi:hypothetical protein